MKERVEQKKERKKQGILDAAYELFMEKGVHKTSVDEIVKNANVAKGTFYLYFRDKEHLLQQLTYQISARILGEAYAYVQEHLAEGFVDNVLLIIDYVVEYFKKSKLTLRLLERNFSWPTVERQLSLREDPLWAKLMEAVEKSAFAANCTEEELYKRIFLVIELIGSTCYAAIIEEKPDTIDNMKPVLYDMVRKMLQ